MQADELSSGERGESELARRCRQAAELLRAVGVTGVDALVHKLRNNRQQPDRVDDLLAEANVAIALSRAGFAVALGDSPDLAIAWRGEIAAVEVKRFRRKVQDDIDDARMANANGGLVPCGDTVDSEGRVAWEQVRQVLSTKGSAPRKWVESAPLVVAIQSDSPNCIEEGDVHTAVNSLADEPAGSPSAVAGVLLMGRRNYSQSRNVWWFEVPTAGRCLSAAMVGRLQGIAEWSAY